MKNPTTAEEWQFVVDGAQALLSLDSARQFGLVEGGPAVNVERCRKLLEQGKARGVTPLEANVEEWIRGFAVGTS